MPDPRKTPKSKYTADRDYRGRVRGRDRHAAAVHDAHGARRRRGRRLRVPAARARLRGRLGDLRAPRGRSGRRSASPRTSRTTPTSRRSITEVSGDRRDRQDDDLHARPQRRHRPRAEPGAAARGHHGGLHRDLHALHAPRLPGALRRGLRAASSARATAASTTSTASVSGGPPVRPLDRFYVRVENGQVAGRPALLGQLRVRAASRATATRARTSTASASTCTPAASRRPSCRLGPSDEAAQAPGAPAPERAQAAPAAPRRASKRPGPVEQAKEAGISAVDWVDERTSLSGGLRWVMFRKVPKGTNWFYTLGSATMFAFLSQAVTGVFLAMYYRPDAAGGAYESVRYITNEVFLGEFVRGMHKWGSTVMVILVFLHMGQDVLLRRLQVPARAELGDRRRAADPHDGDVVHGLPAAVRPALLLGDDRGREHQRHRPARRPVPVGLPARRRGVRRDDAVALLRDPHAADPGRDRRPDRRAPVPRDQARHDGAAVAEGQRRRAPAITQDRV